MLHELSLRKSKFTGLNWRGGLAYYSKQINGRRKNIPLKDEVGNPIREEAQAIRAILELRNRPEILNAGLWNHEVETYINEAVKLRKLSPDYAPSREYVLKAFARDYHIESPDQITFPTVKKWFETEKARLCESTAQHYVRHMRVFLDWLVKKNRLGENVARRIEMGKIIIIRRKVFLPKDTIAELIADVPRWVQESPPYRGSSDRPQFALDLQYILHMGFNVGMRKKEIVEARPDWFNLDLGVVSIQATETFTPKDDEDRTVPLREVVIAFMREYGLHAPFVLRPDSLHRPLDRYRYNFSKVYNRFMDEHGVGHVTVHDMRRSFGSNLIIAGKSIEKVAKWLGDDIETAWDTYAHLLPKDKDVEI